jgi:molybdopterin-guanine dinucleotide biosynthesis protein A
VSAVGFAVAGGWSRRMGRDKALLPWGATDLLGHTLARLSLVVPEVRVLAGPQARYTGRAPVETDAVDGGGPLAGTLAALEAAAGRVALLLAVDLPLVPPALLARLVLLCSEADAAVPISSRGNEPLCAAYGPACLPAVMRQVAAGDLRMTSFWAEVRVRTVQPLELRAFGDPDLLFLNVNEPADYERARAAAGIA